MKTRTLKEWRDQIQKQEVPPDQSIELWKTLVRKCERTDTGAVRSSWEQQLALSRRLEEDYQAGGPLLGYLMNGNSSVNAEITKRERAREDSFAYRPTPAEQQIERIARRLREQDPQLSEAQSVTKAWEENQGLYAAYEVEVAKRKSKVNAVGTNTARDEDDDADECDPDDDECDDNNGEGSNDRDKTMNSVPRSKHKHDYGDKDRELFDPKRAAVRIGKQGYLVVKVRKGGHAVTKLCPSCGAENTPHAALCQKCEEDF
jgi:hypothetical protein